MLFPASTHASFLSSLRCFPRSRCFIQANAGQHLCLSRCLSFVTPSIFCWRMIAIKSEQCCLGWADKCLSARLQNGDERANILRKKCCAVSSRETFWMTQSSVVFPGIWRLWPQTQGLNWLNHTHWGVWQQTMTSCYSMCAFASVSLSLLYFLPPTSSLKIFDRHFSRTWVVWGKEEMISWIHK